jgi:hypothetical protein
VCPFFWQQVKGSKKRRVYFLHPRIISHADFPAALLPRNVQAKTRTTGLTGDLRFTWNDESDVF